MVRRASCVDGAKDRYLLSGDSVCDHGFVCLDAPFQVLGERPAFLGQRKNDAPAVAGQAPPLNQTPVDQVRRRAACARRWERQRMDQPSGNPRLKSRKEPEGAQFDMSRIVRGGSPRRSHGHGVHRTAQEPLQFGGCCLVPSSTDVSGFISAIRPKCSSFPWTPVRRPAPRGRCCRRPPQWKTGIARKVFGVPDKMGSPSATARQSLPSSGCNGPGPTLPSHTQGKGGYRPEKT